MAKICKIDWCEKPCRTRGWCSRHYKRWHQYGDPLFRKWVPAGGTPRISDILQRSKMDDQTGCWIWTGGVDLDGYGQWKCVGQYRAHRVAYIIKYGDIPDGNIICHKCNTPLCVNPAHLYAGTDADNAADKIRAGTSGKGEQNSRSKLTESDVRKIRSDNRPIAILANDFGVSTGHIYAIKAKRFWGHI